MRFSTRFGTVEFDNGNLSGDEELISSVKQVIASGRLCGCNFWQSIKPSLDTEWEAYLTICGALGHVTGREPDVSDVPDNPDGYEPEGIWPQEGFTPRNSAVGSLVAACLAEACAPPPVGTGGSLPEGAGGGGRTVTPSPSKSSARAFGNMLRREGYDAESVTKAGPKSWKVRTSSGKTVVLSTGTDVEKRLTRVRAREDKFAGMRKASGDDFKRAGVSPKTELMIYPEGKETHIVGYRKNPKSGKWIPIYTKAWHNGRDAAKYKRTVELIKRLPDLDKRLAADVDTDDSAVAVMLIRHLGIRPSSGSAKETYGATNLEARHVELLPDGRVRLNFLGKDKVRYNRIINDPAIAKALKQRLEGKSGSDRLLDTDERRANEYLDRALGGNEFNVKDLRTVKANVSALAKMKSMRPPKTKKELKAAISEVVRHVAKVLGNTPQIAKKSYIDMNVFAEWEIADAA